jgi:hypothetical protein
MTFPLWQLVTWSASAFIMGVVIGIAVGVSDDVTGMD